MSDQPNQDNPPAGLALGTGNRVVLDFPGPPPVVENDDIAEHYAVAECPQAGSGLVVYARYRGEWAANPFNCRPVVRVLLGMLAAKDAVILAEAERIAQQSALLGRAAERQKRVEELEAEVARLRRQVERPVFDPTGAPLVDAART